ncbi:hypothetical protein A9G43_10450 [Gilliamella sp. Occ3-1]|uniref:YdgA family protein n=1 Tax=Gilliamella sp. Occ3-1 TaxID=3120253 RepID=UPI00080EA85E|nr:DUF945 family protein [Gilliamella apicola]OCG69659.1 hypothetical protein A9G43_10450 [Gilliamella apicola]
MKKNTLAIGIVAVLGMAYVGTSWYTGNMIENNIDNQLIQITNKINQTQDDFKFNIIKSNYEKNIFSTKLHLTVTASLQNAIGEDAQPKTVFDDDITIHHGPFPIASLAKGSFAPQMAWLEYEMSQQNNPILWKLAGNQPFITGHAGVSYGEYITVKLASKAIKATQDEIPAFDGILELGEGHYTINSHTTGSDISTKVEVDKISFTYPTSFKSKSVSVVINKLVMDQKNILNDVTNTIDGSFLSSVDSIIYGQQNLGNGSIDIDFKGLDKHLFTNQLGIGYPDSDDTEQKHYINFSLNKLNWHNPAGDINLNLMFDMSDIGTTAIDEADYDKINTLKLKLEAPFDVLAHMSTQIENPNSSEITPEQIAKANQNLQMMSAFFISNFQFLTSSNGETKGIYSDISLTKDSDEVNVNGKKVTKEEFFEQL